LIILAFGSCASYQYLTLDSAQMPKNAKKEFTWENDTLRVNYNFNGEGGPITISIYNKTDKPLYIDWNKSAMVRDGHASSLSSPTVQVSGSVTSYGRRVSYGNLSASFEMPEGVNLVPPASDITKNLGALADSIPISSEFLPDSAKIEKGIYPDGQPYKFRRYHFDETKSPLQFKSYLTLVLGNNNANSFSVSHSFYANEVLLTREDPTFFKAFRQGGDKLYIKQPAQ